MVTVGTYVEAIGEIIVILHKYKEMEMPMLRNAYLKRVYDDTVRNNPSQPEFLQAVGEVFESLETYVEMHPELEKAGIDRMEALWREAKLQKDKTGR